MRKSLFIVLIICLFFNMKVAAQTESGKLYKFLSSLLAKGYNMGDSNKISHPIAIKVVLNKAHQVDTVFCSVNTPAELKDKIKALKQAGISWDGLVVMTKQQTATVIIPTGDIKKNPEGYITIKAEDAKYVNVYSFEDDSKLLNPSSFKNVYVLPGYYVNKYLDFKSQE